MRTETRVSFSSLRCLMGLPTLDRTIMSHGSVPCRHPRRGGVPTAAQLTRTGGAELLVIKCLKGRERETAFGFQWWEIWNAVYFVCMHVHMSWGVHMCACGGLKLMLSVFWIPPFYWLRQVLLSPELANSSWFSYPVCPEDAPALGLWELCHVCLAFLWVLGCGVQSSPLPSKRLMHWAMTSAPDKWYWQLELLYQFMLVWCQLSLTCSCA